MARRRETSNWLLEAEADLKHALNSLSLKDYNWACFASQQAAEKAIKAIIIARSRRRPRGHDLVILSSTLKGKAKLPKAVEEGLSELSAFYTTSRYPNAGLERPSVEINRAQAERATRLAKRVIEHAKKLAKAPKAS